MGGRARRSVPAVAGAAAVTSAVLAARQRPARCEVAVFRWFNHGPGSIRRGVWLVMQAGSLGAVGVAAVLTGMRRGRSAATAVLTAGLASWVGAKLVKPVVRRDRPAAYLDDVVVRGRPQHGLGYPSGHAAVATAVAIATTARATTGVVGSRRVRSLAFATAAGAGCARMYSGAHLPLDVVGGVAIGTLAAACAGPAGPAGPARSASRPRITP